MNGFQVFNQQGEQVSCSIVDHGPCPVQSYYTGMCLSFPKGTHLYEIRAPGYLMTHAYKQPNESMCITLLRTT